MGVCADSKAPDWCEQSWCYVSPECPLSKTQTFFFQGYNDLFFSYVNCGGVDSFTADACGADGGEVDSWLLEYEYARSEEDLNDPNKYVGLPTDSQNCNRKPQCAWNNDRCISKCRCRSLPEDIRNDETRLQSFSPSYGSSCAPHDMSYDYCAGYDKETNTPDYCPKPWCYVGKGCEMDDLTQTFTFAPSELYYSYANCGAKDTFSSGQCSENTDETSCEAVTQCDWYTYEVDNNGDGKNDCVGDPLPEGCKDPSCDKKQRRRKSRRLLLLENYVRHYYGDI
jgi:hypothetical protein